MAVRKLIFAFLLCSFCFFLEVRCHGYLHDPPQRSSLWRHGFKAPKNFDDYGLNCGGIQHQWHIYNGKCGVCGDPWGKERLHEDGGKYATGIIGRKYTSGSVIETVVNITAWHMGWFEYKLCPLDDPYIPVSQDCLDQYPLELENGSTKFYPHKQGVYRINIKLPEGVSCSACVLQWKYITTNNWGCNSNGLCGLGFDPYPEQFVNCADIQINSATNEYQDLVLSALSNPIWDNAENDSDSKSSGEEHENTTPNHVTTNQPITVTDTNSNGEQICYPIGPYRYVPGMKGWCNNMCLTTPVCPTSHCECK